MFCGECGKEVNEKAIMCVHCGCSLKSNSNNNSLDSIAPNGKSKVVAAMLALFLGGLGVHKFYLSETGQGIIYLLFCWTFIPAIIAFFEFIILLTMTDDKFNAKYGA